MSYRSLPSSITVDLWGYGYFGAVGGRRPHDAAQGGAMPMAWPLRRWRLAPPNGAMARRGAAMEQAAKADEMPVDRAALAANGTWRKKPPPNTASRTSRPEEARAEGGLGAGPDLSQVAARKNLNETAFFFPHLLSDAEGQVKIEFTMPEALTKWKFLGFAHDAQLRGGPLDR